MAYSYKDLRIHGKTGAGEIASGNIILRENIESHLYSESVTEKCEQYQQKVEGRTISVIDTLGLYDTSINQEQLPGPHVSLTRDEQINEAGKGNYNAFSNTDAENRSEVTEPLEKIDKKMEENGGEHYTNEMYKEAQQRSLEEEEKSGEEEPLSLAQKAVYVGAGVLGGVTGVAGAVVGGAAHGANQTSEVCLQNILEQTENLTAQELPVNTVLSILTVAFNTSEMMLESLSSVNPAELASYGNRLLKASEQLISILVKPTDTSESVSFTLASVEGQVFIVGPQVTLEKLSGLETRSSAMDIDLIGIAKNNNERSAAVAFMSYNTMENLLKPDFFNTPKDTIKTMMSTVISATLPKTTNTKLTKPVNFTLKHIRKLDPSSSLSCVYWNISEWIVDGCSVFKTNSSYTVCSCDHLSTFALMQTSRPPESNSLLVILVCVIVGLVFISLALLTFALYKWSPLRDWMRGCVVLNLEGYNREE
ncbi:adhesion G-protein coupled receptor G2-like [Carassius gibelio]|uniref:adhesion G-protein coupled receptor G2-like n=1 Tax=Carassius gibelio TaxID=101364 RepID=UPI0022798658|nr:adhesion G-protein coupled receptor G2-like [Carassius gibelio]